MAFCVFTCLLVLPTPALELLQIHHSPTYILNYGTKYWIIGITLACKVVRYLVGRLAKTH